MIDLTVVDWFSNKYPKFDWIVSEAESMGLRTLRARNVPRLEQSESPVVLFSQYHPIDDDELLRIRRGKPKNQTWAIWVFDYLDYQLPLLRMIPWHLYDVAFSKVVDRVPMEHSYYLDQACPPWPGTTPGYDDRDIDVLIFGRWSPERMEQAKDHFESYDLAVAGPHWPLLDKETVYLGGRNWCSYLGWPRTDEEMQGVLHRAKVVIGDNYTNSSPGYHSDRPWMTIAAGAVYCGPAVPGTPGLFDAYGPAISRDKASWENARASQGQLIEGNQYASRLRQLIALTYSTKPCRFCGSDAVGVYHMDQGCVCHPEDRYQALCQGHIARATPLGSMSTVWHADQWQKTYA